MFFNMCMVKQNMAYPRHRTLLSNKKKCTIETHKPDESPENHPE